MCFIQEPKSKTQKGKRPYVRQKPFVPSPAQRAASMANFQKARAAPKEKIYAQTPKRKASQLANLAIAHTRRRETRERVVEHLERTFPPLPEEPPASMPAAGEPGTGSGDSQPRMDEAEGPNGGGSLDSSIPDPSTPSTPEASDSLSDETAGARGPSSAAGSAQQAGGVDQQLPGDSSREKGTPLARAIVHRRRAILNQGRREAQRVMRLLIRAAQRSATASREDLLRLAARLMLILIHSRVLALSVQLNWRIEN